MSLSKTSHFFSDVCDKDSTGRTTETTVEQTVVRITREVVRGLVGLDAAGGGERQFDGVYQTVLVVFTQYRTQLDRLVSMMSVTDTETTVRSFGAVLDRLADGQQINCGRVVTALAFAGCVVQHCVEKEIISSDDVNQLAEVLGRKIALWFVNGQHNLVGIHLLSQLHFNSCFPHHRGLAGCPSVLAARAKTFARRSFLSFKFIGHDTCAIYICGVRLLSVHGSFGTKGWTVSVRDNFGTYEINFGTCVFCSMTLVHVKYHFSTSLSISVHCKRTSVFLC